MTNIRWPHESDVDGMTVNERLHAAGVLNEFNDAVRSGDRQKMTKLLTMVLIDQDGARRTVQKILEHPTRYGRIELHAGLEQQLGRIEPIVWGRAKYFPCSVTVRDGEALNFNCTYLIMEDSYSTNWGIYFEAYPRDFWIDIGEVESIAESGLRLPIKFAKKLYAKGESGVGYMVFTVKFSDGGKQAYLTRGGVDFVEFPEGKTAADVVDVEPHVGAGAGTLRTPQPRWCLYPHQGNQWPLKIDSK
jgi:hypothetical protein